MESLGHVLLCWLHGSLPWQGLKAESWESKEKFILERKQSAATYGLFRDLAGGFKKYFEHVGSLCSDKRLD